MVFNVGETVVYPHHGAALIEQIKTRTIRGEEKLYLVLKVAQGDLTSEVPADNCEDIGVRDVVGQEGLDRVFAVLRASHTEEPTNWSRRYKANLEKLASGDVIKVAEVVRDLWRREKGRGRSGGAKRSSPLVVMAGVTPRCAAISRARRLTPARPPSRARLEILVWFILLVPPTWMCLPGAPGRLGCGNRCDPRRGCT